MSTALFFNKELAWRSLTTCVQDKDAQLIRIICNLKYGKNLHWLQNSYSSEIIETWTNTLINAVLYEFDGWPMQRFKFIFGNVIVDTLIFLAVVIFRQKLQTEFEFWVFVFLPSIRFDLVTYPYALKLFAQRAFNLLFFMCKGNDSHSNTLVHLCRCRYYPIWPA